MTIPDMTRAMHGISNQLAKRYTEREMVLAQRAAFIAGAEYRREPPQHSAVDCDACHAMSRDRYPLPKVTRPRVVQDANGWRWRVVDGVLQSLPGGDVWNNVVYINDRNRRTVLADLLANPTETMEDET